MSSVRHLEDFKIPAYQDSRGKDKGPTTNQSPNIHDEKAERSVISSLMAQPNKISLASGLVSPEDFFFGYTREMYIACVFIKEEGLLVDEEGNSIESITTWMMRRALVRLGKYGNEDGQVDIAMITRIAEEPECTPQQLNAYIDIVRLMSYNKKMGELAHEMEAASFNPRVKLPDEMSGFLHKMSDIQMWFIRNSSDSDVILHEESSNTFLNRLYEKERERKSGDEDPWTGQNKTKKYARKAPATGIPGLDGDVGVGLPPLVAIEPSSLSSLLGDTSCGKSTFAHVVAQINSDLGLRIAFGTAELSKEQNEIKRYSYLSRVPYRKIANHMRYGLGLSKDEKEAVERAIRHVKKSTGRVDFYNISGLKGQQVSQRFIEADNSLFIGKGIRYDLIVVDYLQALKGSAVTSQNRDDTIIGNNVKALREIAMKLDVSVLMLSQVQGGREAGNRDERVVPTIHSGFGSSEIENSSQLMFGIWRSKKDKTKSPILTVLKTNFDDDFIEPIELVFREGRFSYQ